MAGIHVAAHGAIDTVFGDENATLQSELKALVKESIAEVEAENGEAPTMKQMGAVMKVANAKAAGQADGKRLSAEVKSQLS